MSDQNESQANASYERAILYSKRSLAVISLLSVAFFCAVAFWLFR